MDLFAGVPFWPVKNGLLHTYPPLERSRTCDVAIVGGGITAACLAHELSGAGLEVAVLDRRDIGTGSTAGSTSLLQYELDTPATSLVKTMGEAAAIRALRLCAEAVERLGDLAGSNAWECGFRVRESFYGASTWADVEMLEAEYALQRRHGFAVRYWDRRRVARESSLPHHAALISRPAAQIDAHCLTHGLFRRAIRRGAVIHDRTLVTAYRATARGVVLETERGPQVKARRIVIAAGYEADAFLQEKTTKLYTTFALITEPVKGLVGWPGRRLLWETARPYFYARTTDDDRIILGGEDEPYVNPRRRERALPGKVRLLLRKFRHYFPRIAIEPAYTWAGTFAVTKDGLPFIGGHPRYPHAYFALGYGGNGITFSVVAAAIIRDLCLGRTNADADLFRFGR